MNAVTGQSKLATRHHRLKELSTRTLKRDSLRLKPTQLMTLGNTSLKQLSRLQENTVRKERNMLFRTAMFFSSSLMCNEKTHG